MHQRGCLLPTATFLLSSPASFISFPWLLHYSCGFPVVLSAGVFLCSLLSLWRKKPKAASTCTYAAMLQWIILLFFSLNSAWCYIDLQYKLRVFLMVIASMLSIILSLYSVRINCFPYRLPLLRLWVCHSNANRQIALRSVTVAPTIWDVTAVGVLSRFIATVKTNWHPITPEQSSICTSGGGTKGSVRTWKSLDDCWHENWYLNAYSQIFNPSGLRYTVCPWVEGAQATIQETRNFRCHVVVRQPQPAVCIHFLFWTYELLLF